jgi:hypothetical protein
MKFSTAMLSMLLVGFGRVKADFVILDRNGSYSACAATNAATVCDYLACSGPQLTFPNGGGDPEAITAFFQVNGLCGAALLDFYMNGLSGPTKKEDTGLAYVHNGNGLAVATCNGDTTLVQKVCETVTVTLEFACSSDVCS